MKWTNVLVGAAFALGGAAGRGVPPASSPSVAAAAAPATEPAPATCTDTLALEANARLVAELRDAQRSAQVATERAQAAETKVLLASKTTPSRVAPAAADWARMAREGVVTLRTPCSTWDASPRVLFNGPRRTRVRSAGSVSTQADFYRVPEEDRDTLAAAYERAHGRTWQAMRAACEQDPDVRAAIASDEEEVATDVGHIRQCASALVGSRGDAMREVAALRARGTDEGTKTDAQQRSLVALTAATQVLFEELVKSFGRERATALVEQGLVCTDESTFDLRDPRG